MCGIVGYVGEGLGPKLIEHLLPSMHHRGPDGEGRHHDGALHMGMRRLAVIDVAGGGQPLLSRDGNVVAFQNGEIYNHLELRRRLEAEGYVFVTNSDTEVLAHGYAHWGIEGLLARIDGMFAIAIHDRDQNVLHLARDRFGEKPLFYAQADGKFGYGSTLLAVSALPWVSDRFDEIAVGRYMALHFVPGERTVFAGVRQVLPGERLAVCLNTLNVTRHSYSERPLPSPRHVGEDELADVLERAVTSRLVSDVPVGVFLSGGLDSSLVAAIAACHNPRIATFSMGFDGEGLDESVHAAAVARHVGSTHHTFHFDQDQFMTLLPEVAAVLDTPIGDQATLPLYWLAQEARKHVTVVLAGEGADEVFAGYSYYGPFAQRSYWPDPIRALKDGFQQTPPSANRLTEFLLDDPPVTPSGFPLLTGLADRRRLVGAAADVQDAWEQRTLDWLDGAYGRLQAATAADIASWLPDDLLVKFDRMSMAHSLEGRAPFLAPEVVELGLALPPDQRMGQDSKVALRHLARRYLPADIVKRRKQGFVLPMRRWIGEWFAEWGGAACYLAARPVPSLASDVLTEIVAADLAADVQRERLLFAVIMLCEWWHAFHAARTRLRAATRG